MRIRFLTVITMLCGIGITQTAAPRGPQANGVLVHKKERTLQLLSHGKVLKTYKIALGRDPVGPKTARGDHKTPEGLYVLDFRNGHSQFYKSIHISYPNARDRAEAHKGEFHRAEMCLFMDYRTATVRSVRLTD